jgi:uncharacterized lipoprotein YddW (UPF0748 family)
MRRAVLALVLAACYEPVRIPPAPPLVGPDTGDTGEASTRDTGTPFTDTGTDSETTDTGPAPELVTVAHDRELRGVWIATVFNINFPSAQGLSAAQGQSEIRALLDVCEEAGLNAVFFQVRPEADALYDSSLDPWSRYLTGTQGVDPGWDPLQYMLDEGHARGIEVHAWLNPYRAKASASSTAASSHQSVVNSAYAYPYGNNVWLDPGAPAVQDHLDAVIADLVTHYDLDGLHFDDYFYPYPDGTPFPDGATYAAYGGGLSLADWRRDNVNKMMERVSTTIAGIDPAVRFGISPFGIYRPGQPAGITGLDQYAELYADPVLWKASGWVDYLAPQLYWPTTQTAQAYEPLLDWWAELPETGRYTFVGHALYQLDTTSAWSVNEFREQVRLTRGRTDANAFGDIWYNIGALQANTSGIRDVFRDELYATPALPPPVFDLQGVPVSAPTVIGQTDGLTVSHPDARFWVVYAEDGADWRIDRIVSAEESFIDLPAGRWAVTAAAKHGVESQGVVVQVGS